MTQDDRLRDATNRATELATKLKDAEEREVQLKFELSGYYNSYPREVNKAIKFERAVRELESEKATVEATHAAEVEGLHEVILHLAERAGISRHLSEAPAKFAARLQSSLAVLRQEQAKTSGLSQARYDLNLKAADRV